VDGAAGRFHHSRIPLCGHTREFDTEHGVVADTAVKGKRGTLLGWEYKITVRRREREAGCEIGQELADGRCGKI
jgi:hypothetical protein